MSRIDGYKVKELRKAKGYTQGQLAEACGVGREYISEVEREAYGSEPSFAFVDRLAVSLGCTVYDVVLFAESADVYATVMRDEYAKGARVAMDRVAKYASAMGD